MILVTATRHLRGRARALDFYSVMDLPALPTPCPGVGAHECGMLFDDVIEIQCARALVEIQLPLSLLKRTPGSV
jgi:hypothetical protein